MPNPNPMPSQDDLAKALQTISALIQQAPHQQAQHAAMVEAATKVDTLDEQIKALGLQKKDQVTILLPLLHALAGGKLLLANNHEVLACISQDKRVSKKAIGAFFEKEYPADAAKAKAMTEALWKSVPSQTREYVSVKRPGQKDEEGEEAPVPAPAATA